MSELKPIIFLKRDCIIRQDVDPPTYRDFITLKKGAFLTVDVVKVDDYDPTKLIVNFGKSATITNVDDIDLSCDGYWKFPVDSIAYLHTRSVEAGRTLHSIELLHHKISFDVLCKATERFISIKGYFPDYLSVNSDALTAFMHSDEMIAALCRFGSLEPNQLYTLPNYPFAVSMILEQRSVPKIKQLQELVKETDDLIAEYKEPIANV